MTLTPARKVRVDARAHDSTPSIRASVWRSGAPFEKTSLNAIRRGSGIRCFSVDVRADAVEILQMLNPHCGGELTLEMLKDVLEVDTLPCVGETYGTIRKVSAFGVIATSPTGDDPTDGAVGGLRFELVEFLAGPDWLILCCHEHPSTATPAIRSETRAPGCTALLQSAAARPSANAVKTGSDLGMLLLHELTRTYSAAGWQLLRWMDKRESDFYAERAAGANAQIDTRSLLTLRGLGGDFAARLHAMDRSAHGETANWFEPNDSRAVSLAAQLGSYAHANVDRAIADVDRLQTMLRSAVELVQTRRMADHLHLQQVQADRTEELEVRVERITSLFLVPSLIAAFFGANTGLPGGNGDHAWESLALMCVLMIAGAASVWIVLGRIRKRSGKHRDGARAAA